MALEMRTSLRHGHGIRHVHRDEDRRPSFAGMAMKPIGFRPHRIPDVREFSGGVEWGG